MERDKSEKLTLQSITLEDTGLFNHNKGQSSAFNRLKESGVNNLADLFAQISLNTLNYGKNKLNDNNYIHKEINGIISLLLFKYLGKIPENLNTLLSYKIDMNFSIDTYPFPFVSYGYPGVVLRNISKRSYLGEHVDSFYQILKSCGFDQTACKALIDIAYEEKVEDITLGEFLATLSFNKAKEKFIKVERELYPFLNILELILDYYNNHYKAETISHKR